MKQIKHILALLAIATAFALLTGCATYHKTTTYNLAPDGQTNSITISESGRTDPLLTKVVEHEVNGSGVSLDFLGIGGYAPFNLKFGNFDTVLRTIPTASKDGVMTSAPYNKTGHQNSSLIQHAGDNNVDTSGQLPESAYHGPNVATANPIVGGSTGTSAPPITGTNAPTAPPPSTATPPDAPPVVPIVNPSLPDVTTGVATNGTAFHPPGQSGNHAK